MEEERLQRKQKMDRLLARVKQKAGDPTTAPQPTSSQTTSPTTAPPTASASSPASPRLAAVRTKRPAAHARTSSATSFSSTTSMPSAVSQRSPSVSLPTIASSAFVLAMQKREEEVAERKQAAAQRRKQREDEAKAELQRKQAEEQLRKLDEAKSLATKQQEALAVKQQIDDEKQRQLALYHEKLTLAAMHRSYTLMRCTGWEGWRRYVQQRREREAGMAERGEGKRVVRLWRAWRKRVELRKAEEEREKERKMIKAAGHHKRYVMSAAFKPWQRLASKHSQAVCRGDAHYQSSVQRAAYSLWMFRMRAVVAANEERLRVLEVRAVAMGDRHLLRFWLLKWKHANALAKEEKQVSILHITHSHYNNWQRFVSLTSTVCCACALYAVMR